MLSTHVVLLSLPLSAILWLAHVSPCRHYLHVKDTAARAWSERGAPHFRDAASCGHIKSAQDGVLQRVVAPCFVLRRRKSSSGGHIRAKFKRTKRKLCVSHALMPASAAMTAQAYIRAPGTAISTGTRPAACTPVLRTPRRQQRQRRELASTAADARHTLRCWMSFMASSCGTSCLTWSPCRLPRLLRGSRLLFGSVPQSWTTVECKCLQCVDGR